jgi:hypothetical protein
MEVSKRDRLIDQFKEYRSSARGTIEKLAKSRKKEKNQKEMA